jgi:hypothetical protein
LVFQPINGWVCRNDPGVNTNSDIRELWKAEVTVAASSGIYFLAAHPIGVIGELTER